MVIVANTLLVFGFLQPVEFPTCGVASTYIVVKIHRQDVSYSDFVEQCRSVLNREQLGTLSIADLVTVLDAYGLDYRGVRFDATHCAMSSLPPFSICYISPEKLHMRMREDIGHFLVYVGFEKDTVRCLDFSGGNTNITLLSEGEFRDKWSGVAIIQASSSVAWWIGSFSLVAVASIVLTGMVYRKRLSAPLLYVIGIILLPGCSNSPPAINPVSPENYPLEISDGHERFIEAETDSSKIVLPVRMVAWHKTDVLLTGVKTSCGCITFDRPPAGIRLARGTSTELRMTLTSDNINGYKGIVVYFEFKLPMQDKTYSIPLTVHTVFTESVPSFRAQHISFEIPYRSDKNISFSFGHYRRKDVKPFRIESVIDSDSVITVVANDITSQLYYNKFNQAIYEDRYTVTVKNKANQAIGQYSSLLSVRLTDDRSQTTVHIPCTYSVIHPCGPSVPRIFSGRLSAGREWHYLVHFRQTGERRVTVKEVKSDNPAIIPKLTSQGSLGVTVKALGTGLHSGVITVTYSDDAIPPSTIVVDYLVGSQ